MKARDGTTLMNDVARPVGEGPFGVVMERTPYLRTDAAAGEFWTSRGRQPGGLHRRRSAVRDRDGGGRARSWFLDFRGLELANASEAMSRRCNRKNCGESRINLAVGRSSSRKSRWASSVSSASTLSAGTGRSADAAGADSRQNLIRAKACTWRKGTVMCRDYIVWFQPGFQPIRVWLERCTSIWHETNTSRIVTLGVAVRRCACSVCAGFVRLSHGGAPSCASRVSRPTAARARLCVDRRLLVPGERPLSVAQRLLVAPPVC